MTYTLHIIHVMLALRPKRMEQKMTALGIHASEIAHTIIEKLPAYGVRGVPSETIKRCPTHDRPAPAPGGRVRPCARGAGGLGQVEKRGAMQTRYALKKVMLQSRVGSHTRSSK